MNLKKLSNEELINIYKEKLVHEFHEEEIKPLKIIEKMLNDELYIGYGLYTDNDKLAAYAFLCKSENGQYLMLDYYVVESEFRSSGIGSKFILLLKNLTTSYHGIIAEIEDPDYATDKNDLVMRKKRINFYEKNGLNYTNIKSSVFEVRYIIMIVNNKNNINEEVIHNELKDIYCELFGKETFNNNIKIISK